MYSDISDQKSGILQECESILFSDNYGKITDDSTLLATFTRYSNIALDRVTSIILRSDNSWEFMDSNSTTLPIEDHNLTSGQKDYTIETTHAKVLKVRVKDPNGDYVTLREVSRRNLSDSELVRTGTPEKYDMLGNSIFLTPTPDYTSSLGLEIQVQSPMSHFVTTDATKVPGFSSMYHRLIPLWACYSYAFAKRQTIAKDIRQEILVMEDELEKAMAQRDYGKPKNLSLRKTDYGQLAVGNIINTPKGFNL